MIILKGAGRPGQLRPDFFSKMDFHRPHVSQFFSNDKDKILQDVSSLPFYPKTRSVDSLFRIPTFFFCASGEKPPGIKYGPKAAGIILKGAGWPGQLRPDFFSNMDFHRPHVSQIFLMTTPAYSKTFPVCRFIQKPVP